MHPLDIDPRAASSLLQEQQPRRLARLLRNGRHLAEGWDANLLVRMDEEARFLAAASSPELAQALRELGKATSDLLDPPRLPDSADRERVAGCVKALERFVPAQAAVVAGKPGAKAGETSIADVDLPMSPEQWREFVYGPSRAREAAVTAQAASATSAVATAPVEAKRAEPAAVASAAAAAAPSLATSIPSVPPPSATPPSAPMPPVSDSTSDYLARQLRVALDRGTLSMGFQPIMTMRGESTAQFQALLRLRDELGDLHTAAELLPAAEQAGLLGSVDRWMLEHCIGLIAQRARDGQAIRLYVPQSLSSARNGWAATRVARVLAQHQVVAHAVSLELHVADVAAAVDDVARYVSSMRALGCGFVLSDFETGVESVLDGMTVDAVRLSSRHLQLGDAQARAELKALVDLVHERGVRVIAPRVDGAGMAAALFAAGVDYIQGNFVQPVNGGFDFEFRETST